jgi:hypothetical protein
MVFTFVALAARDYIRSAATLRLRAAILDMLPLERNRYLLASLPPFNGTPTNRGSIPACQFLVHVVKSGTNCIRKPCSSKTSSLLRPPPCGVILVAQTTHGDRSQLIAHACHTRIIIVAVRKHNAIRQGQGVATVRTVMLMEVFELPCAIW